MFHILSIFKPLMNIDWTMVQNDTVNKNSLSSFTQQHVVTLMQPMPVKWDKFTIFSFLPPIVLSWYSWNCPLTKRNTKLDLPTADSPSNTSLNWHILPCPGAPLGRWTPPRLAIGCEELITPLSILWLQPESMNGFITSCTTMYGLVTRHTIT